YGAPSKPIGKNWFAMILRFRFVLCERNGVRFRTKKAASLRVLATDFASARFLAANLRKSSIFSRSRRIAAFAHPGMGGRRRLRHACCRSAPFIALHNRNRRRRISALSFARWPPYLQQGSPCRAD